MSDPIVDELSENAAATQRFRSQVGHISKHSGVLFAGTVFTVALGYVFKVYLARVLGAEALGVYALGMTLVGFVGVFNSLGFAESAVRYGSVYRSTGKLEQLRALLLRGGLILLAANVLFGVIFWQTAGVVASRFYHSRLLAHYLPWFVALMVIGVISTFYGRILAGYKAVGRRTIITNFIGNPATMLLAVILIQMNWGLSGYLLAQVLSAVLVLVLVLMVVWKLTPLEARFFRPWPARLEPEVWSFSAAAMGIMLLDFFVGQTDKIALGFYLGARSVGIYSVGAAVVVYESLVLSSVNQVFSPIIADLHARGDHAILGRLYKALAKWVLGLTLPLAITVIVYARSFMRIFGHDFEAGWPILIIGTVGQLVNCGVGSVGLLLWMSGNMRRLLRTQAAMAAIMIVANIALIPIWGIIGAAVAAAITNAGTNIWNLLSVRKVFRFSPFGSSFVRLLAPSVASVLVALVLKREASLLGHDWLAILISLLGTYGVFAGVTAIFGLAPDDRLVVDAMWSRVGGRLGIRKG